VNGKEPTPGFDLESLMGVFVETDPAAIRAADLVEVVRDEFQRQGEILPPAEKLLVLARVIAGYARTSPLQTAVDDLTELAVTAFVTACPVWWTRDHCDYGKVAAFLDDALHQREVTLPTPAAMDLLHGLTIGLMRRKQMPRTHAAQLAMADWVAALYLAGQDDW